MIPHLKQKRIILFNQEDLGDFFERVEGLREDFFGVFLVIARKYKELIESKQRSKNN